MDEQGKRYADILKVGLGVLGAKEEGEIIKTGHDEIHSKGYKEAERLHKVTRPCDVWEDADGNERR